MKKVAWLILLASGNSFAIPCSVNKIWTKTDVNGSISGMDEGVPFDFNISSQELKLENGFSGYAYTTSDGIALVLTQGDITARAFGPTTQSVQVMLDKGDRDNSSGYSISCLPIKLRSL